MTDLKDMLNLDGPFVTLTPNDPVTRGGAEFLAEIGGSIAPLVRRMDSTLAAYKTCLEQADRLLGEHARRIWALEAEVASLKAKSKRKR